MQYAHSILDLIGNTPLVRISRVTRAIGPLERQPLVLAKLETLNPGGSVKDRIGLPMIEAAERDGLLRPGGTIIEPTSGNTGHGLAIAAAIKGYRCVFVMSDKQSAEKQAILRAYGAEVVLCPTNVPPESPESYYSVAARLARDIPGAYKPDQYWNAENPAAHEATTGPEIWRQTAGRLTHLVASVGTGGTLTGAARYLRSQRADLVVVGADPEGSILSGDVARPYLTEGIGEDFIPGTLDPGLVDRWVRVSDRDAFAMARRITREEGILAGESCGTAMLATLQVARELTEAGQGPGAVMVVILPDGGSNYLSKLYNDEWMRANGLLASAGAVVRVREVLEDRHHGEQIPDLVLARTTEKVGAAIRRLEDYGISQMPVSEAVEGSELAGLVGSISEKGLLERAYRDPAVVEHTVGEVMDPPLPVVQEAAPLDEAFALLARGVPAVLAVRGERPVGLVTKLDVLEYLSHHPRLGADGVPDPQTRDAFATRVVHAGGEPDALAGAVSPPIYQTSTYAQDGVGRPRGGYEYARTQNPTRERLERAVADLEGGTFGIAFASGSAATATLAELAAPGEQLVVGNDVYGGTYRFFEQVARPRGVLAQYMALARDDPAGLAAAFAAALGDRTRLVWFETPSNPLLKVTDIASVARGAHAHVGARGAAPIVVVDNTFASPALQRPLELGADVVFHSATKYLAGHSDTVAGVVVTSREDLATQLRFLQNVMGAVPGPQDCFLVLRGLRTLALRAERHAANALAVACFLADRDDVAWLRYPGLADGRFAHPQAAIAAGQMTAGGGMVSFVPAAGGRHGRSARDRAVAICESTRLFTLAESLGGVESLIELPAVMTHASVATSPLQVPDALIRLSVGIEDAADLVADLAAALDEA